MSNEEMLKALESIHEHIQKLEQAMDELNEQRPDGVGVFVKARIPELTQSPVGEMIIRQLLPDHQTALKDHKFEYAMDFYLMSLDVEVPGLIAALSD
jgi:hypothetical protein